MLMLLATFWCLGDMGRVRSRCGLRKYVCSHAWPHAGACVAGIELEPNVICECVDFDKDDSGMYPVTTITWQTYESTSVAGEVLRWRALPLKYQMLETANSLQSKGKARILITADFVWTWDQLFTLVTRATEPPPAIGGSLKDAVGCIGLLCLPSGVDVFDPLSIAFGLHPKVAERFKSLYNKPVPPAVLCHAAQWLALHNKHHLAHEATQYNMMVALRGSAGVY